MTQEQIYKICKVNTLSVFMMTHKLIKKLRTAQGNSAIINMGSYSGYQYFPNIVLYGATKAAIIHFTETMTREVICYKRRNVHVLGMTPLMVDTEMLKKSVP